MDYMIPKSTHHLEKVISELRVDKGYLEKRLAEAEQKRDELLNKVIDKFKSEIDHMRQFRSHPEMSTIRYQDVLDILEQFKQQKVDK